MIKYLTLILSLFLWSLTKAQDRPDICRFCKMNTTGGYTSICDTVLHNPICNYEVLTKLHLDTVHLVKIKRSKIHFFPHSLDKLYNRSGYSRGHVIPFEDLAYNPATATASMDLNRNLAPQPQKENIGTKLACENLTRTLADQYGSVSVYGGTFGSYGVIKGINIPAYYWTVIKTTDTCLVYLMPTVGRVKYNDLEGCRTDLNKLTSVIGFNPIEAVKPSVLQFAKK